MRTSNFGTPKFSPSYGRQLVLGCLLLGGAALVGGCSKSTPAAPVASARQQPLQQEVQNDPNVSPEKKQQIADALARSQAAASDPRAMAGRPAPTPR